MSRVVFVHLNNGFTGSPRMLSQFIECNSELLLKHNVYLITNSEKGLLPVESYKTRLLTYKFDSQRKLLSVFRFVLAQIKMFYHLLLLRPERVVVNTIHPLSALIYCLIFRIKTLVYLHEHGFNSKYLSKLAFSLVSKFDCIVVSKSLKHKIGIEKKAIILFNCHSMVPISRTANQINSIGLVTMANFEKKGLPAFITISKHFPNLKFIVQTGLNEEDLKRATDGIHYPNIFFEAQTRDMQSFYGRIDLLLNLSNPDFCIETFGLTLIEAQATGIPVIGPSFGGPLEIINDEVDGFLVDPRNIDELVSKIELLSSDRNFYNEMCKKALVNSKRFSEQTYCLSAQEIMNFFMK